VVSFGGADMKLRVAIAYHFHDRDWLGGKNYFSSLFRAIEVAGGDVELVLVTGKQISTTLPDEFPEIEIVRTSLLDRMHPLWLLRQFGLRKFDSDPLLARLLRKLRIDVLSHSGHLGRDPGLKTLAWLYDFQFLHLPEYWQAKHVRWAEQRYKAACGQCDGVIVSSRDALSDLERFAPECRAAKHVLPFVSNPIEFDKLPSAMFLRDTYGLPPDYFYLPNQFWTNKNHRLAVEALAALKRDSVYATIVCTGKTVDGRRPEYFDELIAYCEELGVSDRIKILGVIPYVHSQGLMEHSRAVINPSRFEGWSTTVEEAKTFHKTLLLSDIGVHREQSPALGRFFSTNAPQELADHMARCLQEPLNLPVRAAIEADYQLRLKAFGEAYLSMLEQTANLPLHSAQ
jgi:glycosyltransferase involved in cell wall biosynthesis